VNTINVSINSFQNPRLRRARTDTLPTKGEKREASEKITSASLVPYPIKCFAPTTYLSRCQFFTRDTRLLSYPPASY
jgi:hypothetical protein